MVVVVVAAENIYPLRSKNVAKRYYANFIQLFIILNVFGL